MRSRTWEGVRARSWNHTFHAEHGNTAYPPPEDCDFPLWHSTACGCCNPWDHCSTCNCFLSAATRRFAHISEREVEEGNKLDQERRERRCAELGGISEDDLRSESPEEPGSSPDYPWIEPSWQAPELRGQHGLEGRCQRWLSAVNEWEQGPEALRLAVAQARHLNPFLCGNGEKGAHVLRV